MATNFYKTGGSYYTTAGQKIANPTELQNYAQQGGKEVTAPTLPTGAVNIPGSYNTSEAQNAAYSSITPYAGGLYGIPKYVTTEQLGNIAPINTANVQPTSSTPLVQSLQDIYTQDNQPLAEQSTVTSTQQKILDAIRSLGNKGADLTAAQNAAGVSNYTKQLADINTQIAQKKAMFDKMSVDESGKPILNAIIGGRQSLIARQSATELGGLSSVAQAIQGNLAAAQSLAQQTVDNQYADKQSELDALKTQLEFNYQDLTAAQKKQADKLQLDLQTRQEALDQQKTNSANVLSIAQTAAQNGADAVTINNILKATTPAQAMIASGNYLSDAKKQELSIVSGYIQSFPDAGIQLTDTLAQAQAKLKSSPTYIQSVTPKVSGGGGGGYTSTSSNPQVDSWVKLINSGQAKITSVPAALKNAVAMQLSAGQSASMTQNGFDILSSVNSLLNSNTNAITGIGQSPLTMLGITNQSTINTYNQLKGLLALDNRQKLKGSGAISDFESKTLADAASRLSRTLSNTAFRDELSRIQGTLLTASGNEAMVIITDPKTGQSQTVMSTRAGIEAALKDGLDVKYK